MKKNWPWSSGSKQVHAIIGPVFWACAVLMKFWVVAQEDLQVERLCSQQGLDHELHTKMCFKRDQSLQTALSTEPEKRWYTVTHFYWWEPSPNLNVLSFLWRPWIFVLPFSKSLVYKMGHNFLIRHMQGIFPTMATYASCWTDVLPPKLLCPWIISRRRILLQEVHNTLVQSWQSSQSDQKRYFMEAV